MDYQDRIEFNIGDVVYLTFSPTRIIKGEIFAISFDKDSVSYSIPTTTYANFFDGECKGTKNVFGSLEEAQKSCVAWGKERNKDVCICKIEVVNSHRGVCPRSPCPICNGSL